MVARFLAESIHTRDGSLENRSIHEGVRAVRDVPNRVVRRRDAGVAADAGPDARVRRGPTVGQDQRRPVGQTAVHTDLKLLKSMMTWATMVYENGRPLLDRNPLIGFVVPKEPNPNRPVVDDEIVEKLSPWQSRSARYYPCSSS